MVFRLLVILVFAFSLSACASMQSKDAIKKERMLSAAGFQMRLADTSDKLAQIEAMPQRKLVPSNHEGRTVYLFADAKDCKCLYAGTEAAYQRFERISLAKEVVDERRDTAEANEAASMNVDAWGPWGPWY